MKQGPGRFRRVATACAAGTIALSFLSVLAITTPAGAVLPTLAGTTVAASAPTIRPGIANQAAGNWAVTLTPGAIGSITAAPSSCAGTPAEIEIILRDFNEGTTVTYDHVPTVTAPSVVGNAGFAICTGANAPQLLTPGVLGIFYSATATTTVNQPINITNVAYDTTALAPAGPVVINGVAFDGGYANTAIFNNITPQSTSTDGLGAGHFYDPTASNAAISTSNFGNTLFATTSPNIGPGATSAAGAWVLPLNGSGNSWTSGDKIYITVARNNATNCETAGSPDSIGFSAVPTVTSVAAFNGATTTPTVTASLAQMGSCSSFSGI